MGVFFQGKYIMTHCFLQLCNIVALSDQQLGHNGSSKQNPDHQTRPHRQRSFSHPSVQKRFDHSQVALQADARYRLSRTVNISIKQSCDKSAGDFTKYPVVCVEVIVNTQCEREHEQQVWEGQVQVENYWGQRLGSEFDSEEGQNVGVGRDTNEHGQDVRWRYDPGAENPRAVGCHRAIKVHIKSRVCVRVELLWELRCAIHFIDWSPKSFWYCCIISTSSSVSCLKRNWTNG